MAVVFQQPNFPLWLDHILSTSIATADFDPVVQLVGNKLLGNYIHNGFALKNAAAAAGFIRAITLFQYRQNHDSLTGLVPTTINLAAAEWCMTPLMKVFAANHALYPSVGMTTIDIGWIF